MFFCWIVFNFGDVGAIVGEFKPIWMLLIIVWLWFIPLTLFMGELNTLDVLNPANNELEFYVAYLLRVKEFSFWFLSLTVLGENGEVESIIFVKIKDLLYII